MSNIKIKEIAFQSEEQKASVALRYEVLRKPLNLHFLEEDLQKEYLDFHIAAYLDGNLVGILLLKPAEKPQVIKMRQVAVDASLQGRGIGKAMVLFSEEFIKTKGFTSIELHARETAVPFYLSMNYAISGERFEEVGIPHFKMLKQLS